MQKESFTSSPNKRTIYIPTDEDISKLQKIKASNDINKVDIYGYLVAKTIEKLINDYYFLRHKDIPVTEIPEVIHGVCYVYHQEVYISEYAKYDADLCHSILNQNIDPTISVLDELHPFAHSVQFNNKTISMVLDILDDKLKDNPKYRFIYSESELLNAIFGVDYQEFLSQPYNNMVKLIHIDPIYALKFDPRMLMSDIVYPNERIANYRLGVLLEDGIRKFKQRYDLSEYVGYDYESEDMTNPQSEQVKKLIKFLHNK